jgi:hypothetical protein
MELSIFCRNFSFVFNLLIGMLMIRVSSNDYIQAEKYGLSDRLYHIIEIVMNSNSYTGFDNGVVGVPLISPHFAFTKQIVCGSFFRNHFISQSLYTKLLL